MLRGSPQIFVFPLIAPAVPFLVAQGIIAQLGVSLNPLDIEAAARLDVEAAPGLADDCTARVSLAAGGGIGPLFAARWRSGAHCDLLCPIRIDTSRGRVSVDVFIGCDLALSLIDLLRLLLPLVPPCVVRAGGAGDVVEDGGLNTPEEPFHVDAEMEKGSDGEG